jgi:hypothetical protein
MRLELALAPQKLFVQPRRIGLSALAMSSIRGPGGLKETVAFLAAFPFPLLQYSSTEVQSFLKRPPPATTSSL